MDQNNTLEISFDEWRSFFLVHPALLESVTGDPHEMLRYWRGATVGFIISVFFLFCLVFVCLLASRSRRSTICCT